MSFDVTLDHEEVLVWRGARTGLPVIVGIHSTALGPALGGLRLMRYPAVLDAIGDCLRLSRGMTYKAAAVDNGTGGGKSVVPLLPGGPQALDKELRQDVLMDVADIVHSLGGRYIVGPDVGTGADDMQAMRRRTPHVGGHGWAAPGVGLTTLGTALGVESSMLATAAHVWGEPDLGGRRVAIVGFGGVGRLLAELLIARGAEVNVSDVDVTLKATAEQLGARWVANDDPYVADVDIVAPCALGGVLTTQTVARMRCRAVVGAANNQLAADTVAADLAAAGIVWAPDFVTNAGGIKYAYGIQNHGFTPEQARQRLDGIGATVSEVLATARDTGITSLAAAYAIAQRRIDAGRAS